MSGYLTPEAIETKLLIAAAREPQLARVQDRGEQG
jgi:hypothetical protein